MARNHARIHVAIWQDPDFLALDGDAQRLYLFLLSQPNLTHLGVLPLTLRRWAQASADYSTDRLLRDLHTLEDACFVVLDDDAEELLIRTLMRNDGVYKQPNVMRAGIASAPAIHSNRIKQRLRQEILRIDLSDVAEEKGRRDEAKGLLDALAVALADGPENPTRRVQETPPEGLEEPQPEPPTHTRAQPLVLSPSPTPTTTTSPSPLRGDDLPAGFESFWDEYPRRVGKQDAIKAYRKALTKTDPVTLLAGALAYKNDPNRDPEYTAHPATWLNRGSWDDDPLPARGLRAVPSRVSEGDALLRRWHDEAVSGQMPELGA